MLVSGEAGVGKSALLDAVVADATDFAVLRLNAVEFESAMAYSHLYQLFTPRLPLVPTLPAPRRDALEVAFGIRQGAPPDRFLVGLGVVSLLAAAAPTLCVIDDAQWLDQATADALTLAARHLSTDSVAIFFGVRDDPGQQEGWRSITELRLTPLADGHARELLSRALYAPLDTHVREQILSEARGNPLAILELGRGFGPGGMAGGYRLPAATSTAGRVEQLYSRQLQTLPADARAIAQLAAADPTGDPLLLWRAAAASGIERSSAVALLDTDLLEIDARVRFRHPLVRSAVYQDASPEERRRAHAALARATDEHMAPDRLVWHRAQAAHPPDEAVSVELESTAHRARSRGGAAAAAAFLDCAVVLAAGGPRRVELSLAAAAAKHNAGDLQGAREHLAWVASNSDDDAQLARTAAMDAHIRYDQSRDAVAAEQLWMAAAGLDRHDHQLATRVFLHAFTALLSVGPVPTVRPIRELALEVEARQVDTPGRADVPAAILHALVSSRTRSRAGAVDAARRAVSALRHDDDEYGRRDLVWAWFMCSLAWDDHSLVIITEDQLTKMRSAGRLSELPQALNFRALAHIHQGDLAQAQRLALESQNIETALGSEESQYVTAILAGWHGDRKAFTTPAFRGLGNDPQRPAVGRLISVYSRLVLCNGTASLDAKLTTDLLKDDTGHDDLGYHSLIPPELVEAAVRAGQHEKVEQVVASLSEHALAADTPWALGIERRCRALLSDASAAEALYLESIEHLGNSATPVQLARSQLLFGEWLRQRGERSRARIQLRAAHEAFSRIGAKQFAARAARELRSAGEVPLRVAAGAAGLTAQERSVAQLVATGATSKEVAAELVVSPRTVDAHLRKIFAKLGVTSRRQIRDALSLAAVQDQSLPRAVSPLHLGEADTSH